MVNGVGVLMVGVFLARGRGPGLTTVGIQTPKPSPPTATPTAPTAVPTPLVEVRTSQMTRFAIVSRQRGGSHFVVELMKKATKDVHMRGEVMDGVWNFTAWSQGLLEFYHMAERSRRRHPLLAAGFILHHNQIWCNVGIQPRPDHITECLFKFSKWTTRHDVRIISLVREAALMIISSEYLSVTNPSSVSVTGDPNVALDMQTFAKDHKLQITPDVAQKIYDLELDFFYTTRALDISLGPSHHHYYLAYESLLGPHRELHLANILLFVNAIAVGNFSYDPLCKAFDDGTKELHPPTCASRVIDWPQVADLFLSSNTLAACTTLDHLLESNSSCCDSPVVGGTSPQALANLSSHVQQRSNCSLSPTTPNSNSKAYPFFKPRDFPPI